MGGKTDQDDQEEHLKKGVIEANTSEWASTVVFVPNNDGTIRFFIDYRMLREVTMADNFPRQI